MSNYASKKELEHSTGIDAFNLAAKSDFIVLKAQVDKLDINELVQGSTGLNHLKTNVDDLDPDKFKTVLINLKKK